MTSEPTPARRAASGLALAAALFAAVVLQPTVVNRLPLPGPGAPDLVLLLVTAIAVATSPLTGAVSGFAAGLALDVAPPVSHYAGQDALAFCLAGYGAARVVQLARDASGERDRLTSFAVMAAAAAAGEAAKAALGLLLAEPGVTGAVISRVLPSAVLYDLLLSPLAYWLVARITRAAPAEAAPVPDFGAWSKEGGGRLASAFRQASAGAAPGLRLAGSGANYQRPAGRPVPRLRLAGQRTPAVARTAAAASGRPSFPRMGGRTPRLNFAGQRPARVAGRPGRLPSGRPDRSWRRARSGLVGGGLAGAGPVGGAAARKPAAMSSAAFRSAPPGSASRRSASRRSVSRRSVSQRTSHRGWLAGSQRSALGRSGRSGYGHGNGFSTAPSRSWLRRRRHPWRRRRQRLLRLVGVGR